MNPARWQRIQALFHDAADLPSLAQRPFLESACGDDPGLVTEVLALLQEDARGASLLDRDVAEVAGQMLGDSSAESPTIKRIGPYRIKELLGEGGMGVVHLAEREDLGSLAAIKILRDAWLSPARRERFASEQRTLAQLRHPSIAQIYDADTLPDGTPWFVMEYVEGLPLTEYCEAHTCSIPERLRLFRAVCEAVQHAHRYAVIHRDLKPSNILVKPDGSVKLLDFGIAKQLESLELQVDQTQTGLRLLTPAYAAPEQIRAGRLGVHTDVYSLGVILYELLAGRRPFDLSELTPEETAQVILEQEPVKPSEAALAMPGPARGLRPDAATGGAGGVSVRIPSVGKASWADLDVLCLTAMHKDPQRRYATVEALIRDIDHYLRGEPLEARPDSVSYRVGKFVRRNRQPILLGGLALAVLVGLVAFYTVRLTTARNSALAEAARTQRIQSFMLNLFEGGDKEVGPADTLRVLTLLDRGAQEARSLDREPEVQAELFQTLGGIYQKLGDLATADSLLVSALEQRRSLFGSEHPQVAKSLVALGLLRLDQAQLEEAERLVREGLEMDQRGLPPDDPAVAQAMLALGRVLEERGAYDPAIQALDEAVRLHSTPGAETSGAETPELAASLYELASVHFYAGHYAASDSLTRRVLWMHRRLYGARHPNVADDLINLGAVQHELGHYVEAEGYYRQALDITRSWYGPDHHRTAANLTMLARALEFQDRNDEAVALLQHALAIRERVFGKVHPLVASTLNELGNVAYMRDQLDEAEADFRRIVDIYRSVYGGKHYLIGIALSNLASVHMDRKEYGRAEQLFREAIAMYGQTLPADHLNTGIARIKLGRVLLRQTRYAEAERETRAGYEILAKQTSPAVSWLQSARKDLVEDYDALGRPEEAARFRAELAEEESG